ncbi:MAG: hypothetical protein Q9191_001215 [Dirinaria sp. TL-2023a]
MLHLSAAIFCLGFLITRCAATTSAFNASYDDEFTIPAKGTLTPVGVYKGLNYTGFDVADTALLNQSADGVIPHSDPNVALSGRTPRSVSSQYTNSKTKSFALHSWYYGCVLSAKQGVASTAKACNVTVTGYKAGSSAPVTKQEFVFTPQQAVDLMNPLSFGEFSSKFTNLVNVVFTVTPTTLTSFVIDNLVGTTTSK